MSRAFRRFFHRPAEIVVGYDEQVVAPAALRAVREAWTGDVPVRTMPFNRAEADPANAMMLTLGDLDGGVVRTPPPEACHAIAAALGAATAAPWRLGIRFDHKGVIVRATVEAHTTASLAAALLALPALAAGARAAVGRLPDQGLQLITAQWGEATGGRWVLGAAHGFKDAKWVRELGTGSSEPPV